MEIVTKRISHGLVEFLLKPVRQSIQVAMITQEQLLANLRPADVLLVEGNTRISTVIKYLTQSNWSHAALYIGNALSNAPMEIAAGTG